MRRLAIAILTLLIALSGVAHAQSERRVALIVANSAYGAQSTLSNPLRDAQLIAASLHKAGFDTIELKTNLGHGAFDEALHQFQKDAAGAEVAMIYYAGHGMEREGVNWLIPTDAVLDNPSDLEYEAVPLTLLVHAVQGARLRMVIIDACRNNPFGHGWGDDSRSVNRGMGSVDLDDVFVLFAAAPGQIAEDGKGSNSPFALALARYIAQPGLALQMLGGAVRDDVLKATGGVQRPFISASITGTPFYLVPAAAPAASPPPGPTSLSFDPRLSELAYWTSCCTGPRAAKADFEGYMRKVEERMFPGTYADIALRKVQEVAADPDAMSAAPLADAQAAMTPPAASQTSGAASLTMNDHAQKVLRILQGHAGGRIHVLPDFSADLRTILSKWVSERCMAGLFGFLDQSILGNNRGNGIAFCADGIEMNEFGEHTYISYRDLNGNVKLLDNFHVQFNKTIITTNWFPGTIKSSPLNFAEMLHAIIGAYLKG